jgi:hypothetical protein
VRVCVVERPGRVPAVLSDASVGLFRADERMFEAMLDGWRTQMLARGLTTYTIKGRCGVLERFRGSPAPSRGSLVHREQAAGSKRWLPALRDSIAFETCYAYGLRRRELTRADRGRPGRRPPRRPHRTGPPRRHPRPGPWPTGRGRRPSSASPGTTRRSRTATITVGPARSPCRHRSTGHCASSSPDPGTAAPPHTRTPRESSGATPPAATSAPRTCGNVSRPSAPQSRTPRHPRRPRQDQPDPCPRRDPRLSPGHPRTPRRRLRDHSQPLHRPPPLNARRSAVALPLDFLDRSHLADRSRPPEDSHHGTYRSGDDEYSP